MWDALAHVRLSVDRRGFILGTSRLGTASLGAYARYNYVPNPSAETTLSGWRLIGLGAATLSRDNTTHATGAYCVRPTVDTAAGFSIRSSTTSGGGPDYRVGPCDEHWVGFGGAFRCMSARPVRLEAIFTDAAGAILETRTTGWTDVTGPSIGLWLAFSPWAIVPPPGAAYGTVGLEFGASATAARVYADAFIVTGVTADPATTSAGDYWDGSTRPDAAWTGAPHLSASVRHNTFPAAEDLIDYTARVQGLTLARAMALDSAQMYPETSTLAITAKSEDLYAQLGQVIRVYVYNVLAFEGQLLDAAGSYAASGDTYEGVAQSMSFTAYGFELLRLQSLSPFVPSNQAPGLRIGTAATFELARPEEPLATRYALITGRAAPVTAPQYSGPNWSATVDYLWHMLRGFKAPATDSALGDTQGELLRAIARQVGAWVTPDGLLRRRADIDAPVTGTPTGKLTFTETPLRSFDLARDTEAPEGVTAISELYAVSANLGPRNWIDTEVPDTIADPLGRAAQAAISLQPITRTGAWFKPSLNVDPVNYIAEDGTDQAAPALLQPLPIPVAVEAPGTVYPDGVITEASHTFTEESWVIDYGLAPGWVLTDHNSLTPRQPIVTRVENVTPAFPVAPVIRLTLQVDPAFPYLIMWRPGWDDTAPLWEITDPTSEYVMTGDPDPSGLVLADLSLFTVPAPRVYWTAEVWSVSPAGIRSAPTEIRLYATL